MEKSFKSTLVFKAFKTKTIAAIVAVASAVVLPQIVHLAGVATGTGSALGEMLLPMHLAIFVVGLLAGTGAGFFAGVLSPVISFVLTGMPSSAMLPFMMLELAVYGLVSGALAGKRLPSIAKLLLAQLSGRLLRAGAIMACVSLSLTGINPAVILTSIKAGIPGIILQWVLVPLIVLFVNKRSENE